MLRAQGRRCAAIVAVPACRERVVGQARVEGRGAILSEFHARAETAVEIVLARWTTDGQCCRCGIRGNYGRYQRLIIGEVEQEGDHWTSVGGNWNSREERSACKGR